MRDYYYFVMKSIIVVLNFLERMDCAQSDIIFIAMD